MERALQKGYLCLFAEKGRGLEPQDPLVAFLNIITDIKMLPRFVNVFQFSAQTLFVCAC